MVKNFNDFNELHDIILKKRAQKLRNNLNTLGEGTFHLSDGSFFRGNIINDYIVCHKKDFSNLFFHRQKIKKHGIEPLKSYFQYFRKDVEHKIDFFKGILRKGLKEGFCQVHFWDKTRFEGFYQKDKKQGFGRMTVPDKFKY